MAELLSIEETAETEPPDQTDPSPFSPLPWNLVRGNGSNELPEVDMKEFPTADVNSNGEQVTWIPNFDEEDFQSEFAQQRHSQLFQIISHAPVHILFFSCLSAFAAIFGRAWAHTLVRTGGNLEHTGSLEQLGPVTFVVVKLPNHPCYCQTPTSWRQYRREIMDVACG